MACKCKERRAKLLAARERKKAQRKGLQAAALGAVVALSEAVGRVTGEGKEDEHRQSDSEIEGSGEGS